MNKKKVLASTCVALTCAMLPTANTYAYFFSTDLFKDFEEMENRLNNLSNSKNINMYKNSKTKKVTIEIALPGFKKEDIKVKINNNNGLLTVKAERKIEKKEEEKNEKNIYLFRSESIEQKHFEHSFTLPSYVDFKNPEKIETSYQNGILKIELPLGENEEKTNEVTLNISGSSEESE